MSGYEIDLINREDSTDVITLPVDSWNSKSMERVHTGVSTWSLTVPLDTGLDSRLLDLAEIYWIDESDNRVPVFWGELLATNHKISDGQTELSGEGIGIRLKRGADRQVYENIPVWWGIEDYVSRIDGWEWSVTPPSTSTRKSGETVADTTSSGSDTLQDLITDSRIDDSEHPLYVDGSDNLTCYQTGFTQEAEEFNDASPASGPYTSGDFSNVNDVHSYDSSESGEFMALGATEDVRWTFTTDYKIPAPHFECYARVYHRDDNGTTFEGRIEWEIDKGDTGTYDEVLYVLDTAEGDTLNTSPEWIEVSDNGDFSLPAGTHRLRAKIKRDDSGTANTYIIDVIAPQDGRFTYTYDNDEGSNNALSGPELYPQELEVEPVASSDEGGNIPEASVSSTWSDTSEAQALIARNNENLDYLAKANTTSATWLFNSNYQQFGSLLQVGVRLGRYGSRTGTTPTSGYQMQSLQEIDVDLDTDDLGIIEGAKDYSDTDLGNLQTLHSEAGMVFSILHGDSLDAGTPTAQSFRPRDEGKTTDWDIVSLQYGWDLFSYWNKSTGWSRRLPDGRFKITQKEPDEITDKGVEIEQAEVYSRVREGEQSALRKEVREQLTEGVDGEQFTASADIVPQLVEPGYLHFISQLPEDVTVESVGYSFGPGDNSASVELGATEDVTDSTIVGRQKESETRRSIGDLADSGTQDAQADEDRKTQEEVLNADGDFSITITGTNSSIEEGETAVVTYDATNNLSEEQTGEFLLEIDGEPVASEELTFTSGETKTGLELLWDTEEEDQGDRTAKVSSGTDSDTATITVDDGPDSIDGIESGDFTVNITSTNSPVQETQTMEMEAEVTENTGSQQTGTFVLYIDGTAEAFATATVAGGATETIYLAWQTETGDAGDYTAEVKSGTDSDTEPVEVTESEVVPPSAYYEVTIQRAELDTQNDNVEVDALIENTGETAGSQGIELEVDGRLLTTTTQVNLDKGAETTVNFVESDGLAELGDDAVVRSNDDQDSLSLIELIPSASGDFNVNITSTNSSVLEGEGLIVTFEVTENTGSEQTGLFRLEIDTVGVAYTEQTVSGGATETYSLVWQTGHGDAGDYTAEVKSGTDSDTEPVTVDPADGRAIDPGALDVNITSADSPVGYGNEATVSGTLSYGAGPNATGDLNLKVNGIAVDTTGITISGGETINWTLTWDTDAGFGAPDSNKDYTVCAKFDREGVGGVQDSDCTTITVEPEADNVYVVDETVTADNPQDSSTYTYATVEADLQNIRYIKFSASHNPNDQVEAQDSGMTLGFGGKGQSGVANTIWQWESNDASKFTSFDGDGIGFNDNGSTSLSDATLDLGSEYSGDLKVGAEDSNCTVSPP